MGFRTDFETGITYIPLKKERIQKPHTPAPRVKIIGPVLPEFGISLAQSRKIREIYSAQKVRVDPSLKRR